jgi:hypothetical protein
VGWEQIMVLLKEHLVRVEGREQPFVFCCYNQGTKSLDNARHGSPFFTMVASHNHQHDWLDI